VDQVILAGGGVRNPMLLAGLATTLRGVEFVSATKFGVPTEAKEALAFAILAYEAYHRRTNNLPSATGANRPVVMGKLMQGKNTSAK